MKPRILLLTQMHMRPHISELFCLSALRLIDDNSANYEMRIHALVSDAPSQAVCAKHNIPFTITCQQPLGRKMNTGIASVLKLYDFDYLLKIDDDDVVDSSLLSWYAPYIKRHVPYFGVNQIYFLCAQTHRAVLYKYPYNTDKLFGPGKMISRHCLEQTGFKQMVKVKREQQFNATVMCMGNCYTIPAYQAKYMEAMKYVEVLNEPTFQLYDDEQTRSLDYISEMNFLLNGFHPVAVDSPKPLFTDVKTEMNIWSYNAYAENGTEVLFGEATSFWGKEEMDHYRNVICS